MKARKLAIALAVLVFSAFSLAPMSGASTASAANMINLPIVNAPATLNGVTGVFNGNLAVTGFQAVNGVLNAVGSLTGTFTGGGQTLNVNQIVSVPLNPVSHSCTILDLTLGPLHLDLLGLVIDLNQVHLTITAVPGAGNLLGNLLCAVSHLLDNGGPLQGIVGLLNNILRQL